MTLSGCIIARDALRSLPAAIASLIGHVDRLLVLVDDRTRDGTQAWLTALDWLKPAGLVWDTFTFTEVGGFGAAFNEVRGRADCDWAFVLDADETIDPHHARNLRMLVERAVSQGADCVAFARINWWNLGRTHQKEEWFPDRQLRLMRRDRWYHWRAHPCPHSDRLMIVEPDELVIHHFNLVYRSNADWHEIAQFYKRQLELDIADGRNLTGQSEAQRP